MGDGAAGRGVSGVGGATAGAVAGGAGVGAGAGAGCCGVGAGVGGGSDATWVPSKGSGDVNSDFGCAKYDMSSGGVISVGGSEGCEL